MENFKRRPLNFQPDVDKRQLRLLRKSVEQKASRDRVVSQLRQVLSPVMENGADPSVASTNGQDPAKPISRREALKKYKERKELEKKLEAQKRAAKPTFKVRYVKPTLPVYLLSNAAKIPIKEAPEAPKSTQSVPQRITRSMARPTAAASQAPVAENRSKSRTRQPAVTTTTSRKDVSAKAPLVQVKTAPPRTRNQRATAKGATVHSAASTTTVSPIETPTVGAAPVIATITFTDSSKRRSPRKSFAPDHYKFVAPVGVAPIGLDTTTPKKKIDFVISPLVKIAEQQLSIVSSPLMPPVLVAVSPLCIDDISPSRDAPALSPQPPLHAPDVQDADAELQSIGGSSCEGGLLEDKLETVSSINADPVVHCSPLRRSRSISVGAFPTATVHASSSTMDVPPEPTPNYFRNLLLTETQKLESLCTEWLQIKDSDEALFDESVSETILAAIGMSKLLIKQRFHQFSELILDCELNRGEKETTCVDLQGFWDMIYFQVEDVNNRFAKLGRMSENNWTSLEPTPKKVNTKKGPSGNRPQVKPVMVRNAERAEAARLRLANAKAAAAANKKKRLQEIPIVWPEPVQSSDVAAAAATADASTVETPQMSSESILAMYLPSAMMPPPGEIPPPATVPETVEDFSLDPIYFMPSKSPSASSLSRRRSRRSGSLSEFKQLDTVAETGKYRPSISPTSSILLLGMPHSSKRRSLRRSVLENSVVSSQNTNMSYGVFSPLDVKTTNKSKVSENLMTFSMSPVRVTRSAAVGKENGFSAMINNLSGLISP